ncbi:hypothetical protein PVAP13_6NG041030 [Panicum virgatum]|uniref:Uncharacterized protein n=1 Tax=Panicum virgatum TaxID=38727 RepID=A0A8T0QUE1_PANVG|nr:hypothetical protein PVAP13_6NG041030 [Panicum virgatum]
MSSSMDDLAKKFDGFDAAMTKVLDKLTALDAWKSAASTSMDKLLAQSECMATRVDTIEFIPPPVPARLLARPATAPPHPPPRWPNQFDLNTAPHQEVRPPASSSERPNGQRVATITRMLAVESLVPTRHTRSRVCVLILLPRSLVVVMIFVLFLANPCPFPKWSFQNSMERTHVCGRIGARCILRCLESVSL